MKAQLYDDAEYVRIFNARDPYALMDCKSKMFRRNIKKKEAADIALKRCGLARKSKWRRESGFYEAQVSYNANRRVSRSVDATTATN